MPQPVSVFLLHELLRKRIFHEIFVDAANAGLDADRTGLGSESVGRVREDVHDDLTELNRIAFHVDVRRESDFELRFLRHRAS
jgi:hypothetical protein